MALVCAVGGWGYPMLEPHKHCELWLILDKLRVLHICPSSCTVKGIEKLKTWIGLSTEFWNKVWVFFIRSSFLHFNTYIERWNEESCLCCQIIMCFCMLHILLRNYSIGRPIDTIIIWNFISEADRLLCFFPRH